MGREQVEGRQGRMGDGGWAGKHGDGAEAEDMDGEGMLPNLCMIHVWRVHDHDTIVFPMFAASKACVRT